MAAEITAEALVWAALLPEEVPEWAVTADLHMAAMAAAPLPVVTAPAVVAIMGAAPIWVPAVDMNLVVAMAAAQE